MSKTTKKTTRSIRFTLVKAILLSGLLVVTIAVALQYYFNQDLAYKSTFQAYNTESNLLKSMVKQNEKIATNYISLLADLNNLTIAQKINPALFPTLANVLEKNDAYSSIYLGFPNGEIQQFIDLDKSDNTQLQIPNIDSARWLLISNTYLGKRNIRHFSYFDQSLTLIREREEYKNDPEKYAWYKNALSAQQSAGSSAIKPASIVESYSTTVPDTKALLAINMNSSYLSEMLATRAEQQQSNIFHTVYLFKANGDVLGSNQPMNKGDMQAVVPAPVRELTQQTDRLNKLDSISIKKTAYYAYVTKMDAQENYLAILVPKETLLSSNIQTLIQVGIGSFVLLLLFSWLFSSSLTLKLRSLVLMVEEAKVMRFQKLKATSTDITELQSLNDLMIEISQSIKKYQTKQKQQIESFIKLTAQAIDHKSPYTLGHANRVPELAWTLIKAAEASEAPPFKDFKFTDKEKQQAFRITAALHSYDKLTTSQTVVSKSSKLEATYNRIHEIRMRFEILWRDAEINYYQESRDNPEQNKPLKEALIKQQLQLMRDFEFIANANIGDSPMTEQDIQRLHEIGAQTWLRYFDDRLGLSLIEKLNLSTNKQRLPAQEYILSDKPEHKNNNTNLSSERKTVEALYNIGELYNLSIPEGTLTAEDKQQLNEYILTTSSLLDDMPIMAEQESIPQDLSAYHPALSDAVYPVNSANKKLSIPENILGISYIFEALTSINNPQQKIETLSSALNTMHQLAVDKRIDMQLFKLFLGSGIYMKFAKKFLYSQQIDQVDIRQYLD